MLLYRTYQKARERQIEVVIVYNIRFPMDTLGIVSTRIFHTSRYLGLLTILSVFLCIPVFVHAQTGVTLQPAMIEDIADPGQTISKTLTVTNDGIGAATYYLVSKDIDDVRDDGTPIFSENEEVSTLDLSSWLVVSDEPIVLSPGQKKVIPFQVQVPADAPPGGHFGGIFLSLEPERPDTIGTGIGYQVGSIVSIQVSGEIIEVAQIREFISDKTLYSEDIVHFTTRIENKGNVLVRPRGPVEVYDMFGKKVGSEIVNEVGGAVFPAAEREFSVSWEGEGLSIGRYEAILALSYGQDVKKTIDQTLSFWILPMNIVGPFLGGLLVLIILIYILIRLYIKRKIFAMGGDQAVHHYAQARAPLSRLTVIVIALLVFTILFLMGLFLTMA